MLRDEDIRSLGFESGLLRIKSTTVTRWKDGIDLDFPVLAVEKFARAVEQAAYAAAISQARVRQRHPLADGAAEMTIDPFADVRNQAMGDLTAEQQDRVWELWLRENTGAMPEYYIDHLQVLFRVIDRLRAEIEQLKTRLEVDPRAPAYDGIDCRDETIRQQDAMLAEVDGLRTELHERRLLIDKMANILERSVNALRGPPPSMVLYTWHDLPERVAAMRAALAELVALKDLKDAGLRSPDDEDEYFRRKPQAWAAAREAITGGNNAD